MIEHTSSATVYSNVGSCNSIVTSKARDDALDFVRLPICNHCSSATGNDITL